MKNIIILLAACTFMQNILIAQVIDTINVNNSKLETKHLKESKSSYAVYFTDSLGKRRGAAQIWDREISFSVDKENNKIYNFDWKWYAKDSMIAHIKATGLFTSMKPLTHKANYFKRGESSYIFKDNIVTVPEADKKSKADSSFKVSYAHPAFEFPMDLEIFGLLPFKKVGQEFAIPFYEPGTPKSDYYHLFVTGKEDLLLPGQQKLTCWLLKIDYGIKGAFATFWISDKTREVVKMKEEFNGSRRYKVRLY